MGRVVIGTDPHKRSATIEVRDEREILLATGRFGMDKAGYRQLPGYVRQWPARVWRRWKARTASAGRWRRGCWPTAVRRVAGWRPADLAGPEHPSCRHLSTGRAVARWASGAGSAKPTRPR
jgi:hypothetical protein